LTDKRDVLEFYKRAVFNVVARNQDDHAKNTSFLMDEKGEWYNGLKNQDNLAA